MSQATAPAAYSPELYPEQVRRIYLLLPIGLIATGINSLIVVAICWGVLSHVRLTAWLSAILFVTLIRSMVVLRYRRSTDKYQRAAGKWGRLLIAGNLLSGLIWGCLPIFLTPQNSIAHEAFQAFVLAGMVAGAVVAYSTLRLAFLGFALPALIPVVVRFFTVSDPMHLAMGTMSALFVVLMVGSSLRVFQMNRSVLLLDFENRHLAASLFDESRRAEEVTSELRRLTGYLDSVREEESKRIATEIHDHLGQALTAARFELTRLEKSCPQSPGELLGSLKSISGLLDGILADVRRIARNLRPLVLDDLGLDAAVEWLADDFQQRTGIRCDLTIHGPHEELHPECSMTVFRVLQEALTNIARHAEASEARIELTLRGDFLVLTVADNGKGILPDHLNAKTFGVLSMRERAVRFGGELALGPGEKGGTVVSLKVPKQRCRLKEPQDVSQPSPAHPRPNHS